MATIKLRNSGHTPQGSLRNALAALSNCSKAWAEGKYGSVAAYKREVEGIIYVLFDEADYEETLDLAQQLLDELILIDENITKS